MLTDDDSAQHKYLNEISRLVNSLTDAGFFVIDYSDQPAAFDNFIVTFKKSNRLIKVRRDRSQFILSGKKEELEKHGLWKAFDDLQEFHDTLLKWLQIQA